LAQRKPRAGRLPAAQPRIPVSEPALVGRELEYVMRCVETNWISARGDFVVRFEREFARLCGVRHAIAVCNGTAALHLALLALGVGPGDEVIVPALTYVASANAVVYCGARPVFVDSEPRTWNLDPQLVSAAITPRTKGILAVHLYGQPADMGALRTIADAGGLFLLEDAAQAHGARYGGRTVGSLGDAATFSFHGAKLVTAGEGGMVLTDDDAQAALMRRLRHQGEDPNRRYHFTHLGFNYGMSNLAAAIGLAQLERIDWHLARRHANAARYRELLHGRSELELQQRAPGTESADWLTSVVLGQGVDSDREQVMQLLHAEGIETRAVFPALHTQPIYRDDAMPRLPVAERLGTRGLSLPSGATLTDSQIDWIVETLLTAVNG
jgi:perosamine synthetase